MKAKRNHTMAVAVIGISLVILIFALGTVWIGQNAVVLPGTRVGDGAIIGANAVVGGVVEPYAIVVGNPARVLRKRFDVELIDLLLRFQWWNKEIDEIDRLIPLLTNSDLETVKRELKRLLN